MEIENNISLKNYLTMRFNSQARYFVEVKTKQELKQVLESANKYFIIGGGSNVIFPQNYDGLVIKIAMNKIEIEDGDNFKVYCEAGVPLVSFSRDITEKGGLGMEWATGVPGSVGGAVRGNAGAFDYNTSDFIESVTALNTDTLKEEMFTKDECHFFYRESIFKTKNNLIVLSVNFVFPKGEGGVKKMNEYLKIRKDRHPQQPSCGSVFKNIKENVSEDLLKKYPEMKQFNGGTIPARYLIEKCGLKGEKRGGAQISEKHCNFIINTGEATKEDVQFLIEKVIEKVKEKFGFTMVPEVEINIF